MSSETKEETIKRLKFENILWLTFVGLSLLNIFGDNTEREFIETNDKQFQERSNRIFLFTLEVTFFIYLYFLIRNYRALKSAAKKDKQLYTIKVLGSVFLILGIILLIYFQRKQTNFTGSPAI